MILDRLPSLPTGATGAAAQRRSSATTRRSRRAPRRLRGQLGRLQPAQSRAHGDRRGAQPRRPPFLLRARAATGGINERPGARATPRRLRGIPARAGGATVTRPVRKAAGRCVVYGACHGIPAGRNTCALRRNRGPAIVRHALNERGTLSSMAEFPHPPVPVPAQKLYRNERTALVVLVAENRTSARVARALAWFRPRFADRPRAMSY